MAGIRKSKKKNTRVFIAIGVAGFLALILLVLFTQNSAKFNAFSSNMQKIEQENKELKEKLTSTEDTLTVLKRSGAGSGQETQSDVVTVVIAKSGLPAGTVLTVDNLDITKMPQKVAPENAFNIKNDLLGRVLSADVQAGKTIEEALLVDKGIQSLSIPKGYRAMTIPIDPITGVGGFITPGSRIDLLTVVPKSGGGKDKSDEQVSKIIIQNVKVLATSSNTPQAGKGPGAGPGPAASSSITIAVPAADAIKIALAYNNGAGNIQTVLRGYQDESKTKKMSIDSKELISGNAGVSDKNFEIPDIKLPKPPSQKGYSAGKDIDLNSILNNVDGLPPPTPPTAQTKTHSIEMIQANSRQEVSFETEI